jgi:hypothetical protein
LSHYKKFEEDDQKTGRKRKSSYLASAQTYLSHYKKRVVAPDEFKRKLHLTKQESDQLNVQRISTLRTNSIDLAAVRGDKIMFDCRNLLTHKSFELKVIAVACLTGRRMTEVVCTLVLDEPKEPHFSNLKYWACASGLLKQRGENRCFDIPLFAPRQDILNCIQKIRTQCKSIAQEDVNRRIGKRIARAMKKYCPEIDHIHNFRKLYIMMAMHYFNERHCSLPRLASDYLGHKGISETVLTYLNFELDKIGSLSFD